MVTSDIGEQRSLKAKSGSYAVVPARHDRGLNKVLGGGGGVRVR